MREIGDRILEAGKQNSVDLSAVQQFISCYLDRTLAIVEKYLKLNSLTQYTADISDSLQMIV